MSYDYTSDIGVTHVNYSTRNYNSIGIGASFYRLGFSLSFELPYSDIDLLKNQKAFSFRGGYSYNKLYGDLRLRRYNGLEQRVIENVGDEKIVIRKDMIFSQIGANLLYFTSSKFNYDANFKNYNRQIKSASTFIASGGYNRYDIDGALSFSDTINKPGSVISNIQQNSFRILPGIAFSIVYKKFYISMLGLMGLSINNNIVELNKAINKYWNYTPNLEYSATIGYSSNSFFASIVYSIENDKSRIHGLYIGTRNNIISIKVGKKIDSKYLGKLAKYL
jgi:hypothetical protein